MDESSASTDERPMGLERLVFFSDAVFAIVITLLVLPIATEVQLPQVHGGLAGQVWALRPKVVSFAISFLVIGQFWIAHHRMFDYVRRADQRLLWLNLVSLLTVSFLPFPSALLGAHSTPTDHFAVVFYAASMTIASLALTVTWIYALRTGLVDQTLDHHMARYFTTRSVLTSALFLVLGRRGLLVRLSRGDAVLVGAAAHRPHPARSPPPPPATTRSRGITVSPR